ncbi:MAG: sulfatase [Planctomycetales bacterium]|nr:sulfatase [Planctomycetales bacterium]
MKHQLVTLVFLLLGLRQLSNPTCIAADDRPLNVLMIVIDDLGGSDLGCYGSDYYQTPHLDGFAANNLRFTQAYAAAPVCSPTRASLLTGQSPARLQLTIWHEGAVRGGPTDEKLRDAVSRSALPLESVTLAELFHQRGYFTAHIGKWHLGTATHYPENQGFDLNVGGTHWGAPATFFYPFAGGFSASEESPRYVPGLMPSDSGDYLTDRLTDRAIETITQVRDRPFFMSLWYHTVHSPIEAPADLVDAARQRPAGAHQKDPTYAAMVARMDWNVGRVLQSLEEQGLTDRTIVIVTSDNGGVDVPVRYTTPTNNFPHRSGKGTLYEGGLRVPLMISWPGRTARGTTCHIPVTSQDLAVTLHKAFDFDLPAEQVVDGMSLLEQLSKPTTQLGRETLYWHFPHYYTRMTPSSALRHQDWKLIYRYEDNAVELYNLADDPSESKDLAQIDLARATALRAQLDSWLKSVNANLPRSASP